MRSMTGTAFAILDGLVLGQGAFLPGHGIAVAGVANLFQRRFHQFRFARGMGRVAVQATDLVDHRPMNPILVEGIVHHVVMAALAEFEAVLERCKRRCRGRLLMTLLAHPLTERFMNIVIQHGLGIGTVRVMTGGTIGLFHRIIDMLDFEGLFAGIVALQAEFRGFGLQQAGVVGRSMGAVTGQTIIADRRVRHLVLGDFLSELLVAAEAELVFRLE